MMLSVATRPERRRQGVHGISSNYGQTSQYFPGRSKLLSARNPVGRTWEPSGDGTSFFLVADKNVDAFPPVNEDTVVSTSVDAGGIKKLISSLASLGISYLGSLTTALGAPRKKRRTDHDDEDYVDDNEDCCEDNYDGLDVSEEEVVAASQFVHKEKTEEEVAEAMEVLEAAQAKALKVKGLNFWSEDSRKHYHELPGVWSMNTQYGVGGYMKVMDLLLDIIDQKEKDPSIDVAAIVAPRLFPDRDFT